MNFLSSSFLGAVNFLSLVETTTSNIMNFANTSLFVGDLPKFASETDLEQLFSPFGTLLDAKIKRNSTTGKTLSYGFVTFASEANAQEALKVMDGNMFSGRKLRFDFINILEGFFFLILVIFCPCFVESAGRCIMQKALLQARPQIPKTS